MKTGVIIPHASGLEVKGGDCVASKLTIKTDSGYGTYEGRYLQLDCEQISKSMSSNESVISWTLSSIGGEVSYYATGPTTVSINGTTVYSSGRIEWESREFPAAKGSRSGTITIPHSADGTKTISVSITTAVYVFATQSYSSSWTLDPINLCATIVSADNFDSNNMTPSLTYTNPNGLSFDACISFDNGTTADIPYRTVGSSTSGTYTFNFSSSELNTIKSKTANNSSVTITYVLRTSVNGTYYTSTLNKTFSVVENSSTKPGLSITLSFTSGDRTNTITGDTTGGRVIKGYSSFNVASVISSKWGSGLKYYDLKCGENIRHFDISGTSSGARTDILNKITSGTITATVYDTRGFSTTSTVSKTLVDYIPLTISFTATNPDGNGNVTLSISGDYFNGFFGANNTYANALNFKYRTKTGSGSYGNWTTLNITSFTYRNNRYDATSTVSGVSYTDTVTFQVMAQDKVYYNDDTGVKSDEKSVKGTPSFYWNKDTFNFNTNIVFDGRKQTGERSIGFGNISSTSGTYPHNVSLYGGDPSVQYAIGIWDALNSRNVAYYNDQTNKVVFDSGIIFNSTPDNIRFTIKNITQASDLYGTGFMPIRFSYSVSLTSSITIPQYSMGIYVSNGFTTASDAVVLAVSGNGTLYICFRTGGNWISGRSV